MSSRIGISRRVTYSGLLSAAAAVAILWMALVSPSPMAAGWWPTAAARR
jgi:hypothetical protein